MGTQSGQTICICGWSVWGSSGGSNPESFLLNSGGAPYGLAATALSLVRRPRGECRAGVAREGIALHLPFTLLGICFCLVLAF